MTWITKHNLLCIMKLVLSVFFVLKKSNMITWSRSRENKSCESKTIVNGNKLFCDTSKNRTMLWLSGTVYPGSATVPKQKNRWIWNEYPDTPHMAFQWTEWCVTAPWQPCYAVGYMPVVLNLCYLTLLLNKITRFTPGTKWYSCIKNIKLTNSYSSKWFIWIYICCNLGFSKFTALEDEIFPRLRTTGICKLLQHCFACLHWIAVPSCANEWKSRLPLFCGTLTSKQIFTSNPWVLLESPSEWQACEGWQWRLNGDAGKQLLRNSSVNRCSLRVSCGKVVSRAGLFGPISGLHTKLFITFRVTLFSLLMHICCAHRGDFHEWSDCDFSSSADSICKHSCVLLFSARICFALLPRRRPQ